MQDAGRLLAGGTPRAGKREAARMLISLVSAFLTLKHSSCQARLSSLHENLMQWFLLLYVTVFASRKRRVEATAWPPRL